MRMARIATILVFTRISSPSLWARAVILRGSFSCPIFLGPQHGGTRAGASRGKRHVFIIKIQDGDAIMALGFLYAQVSKIVDQLLLGQVVNASVEMLANAPDGAQIWAAQVSTTLNRQ